MESDLSHIRMCPTCRSEYQPHIETCLDCGTPLEAWSPPTPPNELPPLEQCVAISWADAWELDARAQYLASVGIPCGIETDPLGQSIKGSAALLGGGSSVDMAIYVARNVEEEAKRLVTEFAATRAQDRSAEAGVGVELEACPACGTEAVADASECHDCGLPFLAE